MKNGEESKCSFDSVSHTSQGWNGEAKRQKMTSLHPFPHPLLLAPTSFHGTPRVSLVPSRPCPSPPFSHPHSLATRRPSSTPRIQSDTPYPQHHTPIPHLLLQRPPATPQPNIHPPSSSSSSTSALQDTHRHETPPLTPPSYHRTPRNLRLQQQTRQTAAASRRAQKSSLDR